MQFTQLWLYQKAQHLLKKLKKTTFILLVQIKTMELMGDKITARQTVDAAGVPVIPGSKDAVNNVSEIEKLAEDIGYPVVLKAASGGGGKGIRIVKDPADLEKSLKKLKVKDKSISTITVYM